MTMANGSTDNAQATGSDKAETAAQTIDVAEYKKLQARYEKVRANNKALLGENAELRATSNTSRVEDVVATMAQALAESDSLPESTREKLKGAGSTLVPRRQAEQLAAKDFQELQGALQEQEVEWKDVPQDVKDLWGDGSNPTQRRAAIAQLTRKADKSVNVDELVQAKVAEEIAKFKATIGKVDVGVSTAAPTKAPTLKDITSKNVSLMTPSERAAHDKILDAILTGKMKVAQ